MAILAIHTGVGQSICMFIQYQGRALRRRTVLQIDLSERSLVVFDSSNYERESACMAERSPSRFALFWEKNGWLGLIIVGAALLVLGISAILAAADEQEQSATIKTEGTVTSLRRLRRPKSEGGGTAHTVYVDFMVDGKHSLASQRIRLSDFQQLIEGQTISVRYLPDNPARIWVASDADSTLASQLRFWGFVLLIFGLFLVWAPWVVAGNELKQNRTNLPK